uniref:Protein CLP1 homolog n=1 Tax=Eutreptiella gymnastica TaxID=73025 RepID=A0A7S1JA38_9EUGL
MCAASAQSLKPFSEPPKMKTFKLDPEMELRFEVAANEEALLKLTHAPNEHAEVFGMELASDRIYPFPAGSKAAVWTWHGCHVQLEDCKEVYPHKWEDLENPMQKYAGIHLRLEEMRRQAGERNEKGPRVMICGPQNSGKNSLCRILLNYGTRMGKCMVYADLDPAMNDIVPGSVAAVAVVQPISIEDKFSLLAPLAYYVGETDCTANADLYAQMMAELGKAVQQRALAAGNEELKHGGVIINTSGLVAEKNVELLIKAIQDFDVNVIYIMDDEKLTATLNAKFKPQPTASEMTNQNGTPLHIEKIVRSGGVVTRSQEVRKQELSWLVKEYFYGSRSQIGVGMALNPHRITLSFSDIKIVKIGGHKVHLYLLPAGASSAVDPCQVTKVDPSEQLQHRLGGLSFAKTEEELKSSNIVGLVWIQSVDMAAQQLTLLIPSPVSSPDQLPGTFLLIGSMVWLDS